MYMYMYARGRHVEKPNNKQRAPLGLKHEYMVHHIIQTGGEKVGGVTAPEIKVAARVGGVTATGADSANHQTKTTAAAMP